MNSNIMELISNSQYRLAKKRKILKNLQGFSSFKNSSEYCDLMFPLFQNEQYQSIDLDRQQYLALLKEGKSFPLVFNVFLNEDHDLQERRSIRLDFLNECDTLSTRKTNHQDLWKTQNYSEYLTYKNMKSYIMAVYAPSQNNSIMSEIGLFCQSQSEQFIEIPLPNRLIDIILDAYENNYNGIIQLYFQPLCSTSMYINEANALLNIKNCPFENLLLKPSEQSNVIAQTPFSIKVKAQKEKYFKISDFKNKFNQSQLAAISDAVNYEKKMTIIMGPPGTGKTQTTIGIISIMSELLHEAQNNKKGIILVLAKSNKVVNDLVRKINYNIDKENSIIFCQKSKPDFLKVVRIGRAEKCEEDISKFSLEIRSQNYFFSYLFKSETQKLEQKHITDDLKQKLQNVGINKNIEDLLSGKKYFSLIRVLEFIKCVNEKTKDKSVLITLGDYYLDLKQLLIKNKAAYEEIELRYLTKCNIVVSTLNSCSQRCLEQYFDTVLFRMCIIDEAPTALEPSLLIPFVKYQNLQKVVLLGDIEQLEPITVAQESKNYKFNRSMFERLAGPLKHNFLRLQYRQMPNLAEITSKVFYEGKIGNGLKEMQFPQYIKDKVLFNRNRLFFNTPQNSEHSVETSKKNNLECQAIISLVKYLLESNPQLNEKITIISAYRAQRDNLHNSFVNENLIRKVELDTVDSFQGKENDIIILSLVRSNQTLGFLKDKKRINVSLSRARYCQFIFGTIQTAVKSRSMKWMNIIRILEQQNEVIDYTLDGLNNKQFYQQKLCCKKQ